MTESVERIAEWLKTAGLGERVRWLREDTSTAERAAAVLGCPVGAIVKSLVFLVDDRPVLVLVSGDRRVDPARLAVALAARRARLARAAEVQALTGYAVGGVPPRVTTTTGEPLATVMDRSLFRFPVVWASAGSPYAVFPASPAELQRATAARVAAIVEEEEP